MTLNLDALRRTDLFPLVKAALKAGGTATGSLCDAGMFIARAITSGWFLIPAGRNHSYSKAQYFALLDIFRHTPWHLDLQAFAALQQDELQSQLSASDYSSLWSHPSGLSSFKVLASRSMPARMPHQWASGEITLDLVHQCLIDSIGSCELLKRKIRTYSTSGVLLPASSLAHQVDTLNEAGLSHEITALLTSTRRMYLTNQQRDALRSSLVRPNAGAAFEALVKREQDEQIEFGRSCWRSTFGRIHQVAGVYEDIGHTEHLGTINRRLRERAGPAFKIGLKDNERSLLLALGENYYAGRHVAIDTHWAFRNWIIALSDQLLRTEPTYADYIKAEQLALARLDLEGAAADQEKPWRPYDDFEDETVRRAYTPSPIQHSTERV